MSFRLNFCRSLPPEFLRSFLLLAASGDLTGIVLSIQFLVQLVLVCPWCMVFLVQECSLVQVALAGASLSMVLVCSGVAGTRLSKMILVQLVLVCSMSMVQECSLVLVALAGAWPTYRPFHY